jgi:hypothetical protein
MSPTASQSRPQRRPAVRPPPKLSDERLQALAEDLIEAFARIARRRF